MDDTQPDPIWEVTILEFFRDGKSWFNVTRRFPEMSIAETRVFASRARAKEQFENWLG